MNLRPGLIFVGALWIVGLATGLVVARAPELLPIPMPYFLVPLGCGLLVEMALRTLGAAAPITTAERATGVLGGAIIGFAVAALAVR